MSYFLVIFLWLGGYVNGPNSTTLQFNSESACLSAKATIMDTYKQWDSGNHILAMCVPKG